MILATVAESTFDQFTVSTCYLTINEHAQGFGTPLLLSTAVFNALGRPVGLWGHRSWEEAQTDHGLILGALRELVDEGRGSAAEIIQAIRRQ